MNYTSSPLLSGWVTLGLLVLLIGSLFLAQRVPWIAPFVIVGGVAAWIWLNRYVAEP